MRVVCDNCGASYKIPETKLVKEVNKATCRKCGHRMLIRKGGDGDGATQQMDENPYLSSVGSEEFRSAIAAASAGVPRVDVAPRSEWEEEDPTHIAQMDEHGDPIPPPPPPIPRPAAASPAAPSPAAASPVAASPAAASPAAASPAWASPAPAAGQRPQPAPVVAAPEPVAIPRPAAPVTPPPVAIHSPGPSPHSVPAPPQVAHSASPAGPTASAFDPSGDLSVIGFGVIVAAIGGLLLAVTDGGFLVRFAALFLALWGTLTSLFVVVTGSRGRRKASVVLSTVLGTLFAVVGSGAVIGAKSGAEALAAFSASLGELAVAEVSTEPPEAPEAPLGTLFAEEPVAEAAPEPAEAEPVAEAAPEPPAPEPEPPAPEAPAPEAKAEPKAREPSVERESAYVAPPSEPARSPSSSSSSSSSAAKAPTSSSSTSSSKGSSSSSAASEPAPSSSGSAKSAMSSLPPTVVDTMVKSNQSVKKCMYQEFKRSDGNLGSVTVRFKVLSSGKVSSASVLSSRYKGTELDTCMTAALYTVTFPSFDGDAQSFDITLGT